MQILAIIMVVVLALALWAGASLLIAFPFMALWNFAIVHAFHAPELGYWHAWALLVFSSLFIIRPATKVSKD